MSCFNSNWQWLVFGLVAICSINSSRLFAEESSGESAIFADLNDDGVVNERDVNILTSSGVLGRTGYRVTVDTWMFDLNCDMAVNQLDIEIVVNEIVVGDGFSTLSCVYGDINLDGSLEGDYEAWCNIFLWIPSGWEAFYSAGDLNGDGLLNLDDLSIIVTALGNNPGHSS